MAMPEITDRAGFIDSARLTPRRGRPGTVALVQRAAPTGIKKASAVGDLEAFSAETTRPSRASVAMLSGGSYFVN